MNEIKKTDWSNNDVASPVLWLDLVMTDLRDYASKGIQATDIKDKQNYLNFIHEYVRGIQDGNRFMRKKPELIKNL